MSNLRKRAEKMLEGLPLRDPEPKTFIAEVITRLKRQDRVVWFLRHYKRVALLQIPKDTLTSTQKKWINRYDQHYENGDLEARTALNERFVFYHYIAQGHPADLGLSFDWRTVENILDTFEINEQTLQQNNAIKKGTTEAYGQAILSLPGGGTWWDLGVSSCKIEAELMDHCGNGNGAYEEVILSYRTQNDDGTWTPHLTFIYNTETHSLGEMKGYSNQKPTEEYHEAIIALLEHPMIEKVVGGGYLPENNFSLSDLDPEREQSLYQTKRSLYSLVEQLEREGMTPDTIDSFVSEAKDHTMGNWTVTADSTEIRYPNFYQLAEHYFSYAATEAIRRARSYVSDYTPIDTLWDGKTDDPYIDHPASSTEQSGRNWFMHDEQSKFLVASKILQRINQGAFPDRTLSEVMDSPALQQSDPEIAQFLHQGFEAGVICGVHNTVKQALDRFSAVFTASLGLTENIDLTAEVITLRLDTAHFLSLAMKGAKNCSEALKQSRSSLLFYFIDEVKEALENIEFAEPSPGFIGWSQKAAQRTIEMKSEPFDRLTYRQQSNQSTPQIRIEKNTLCLNHPEKIKGVPFYALVNAVKRCTNQQAKSSEFDLWETEKLTEHAHQAGFITQGDKRWRLTPIGQAVYLAPQPRVALAPALG